MPIQPAQLILGTSRSYVRLHKGEDAAIEAVKPGVAIGTLGGIVAQEIKSRGFLPVANLTGHGLDQYCLHKGPNVPNIPGTGGAVLEEGMVIAIEPFASTGTGFVHDGSRVEIFSQLVKRPVRLPAARKILKDIEGLNGLLLQEEHKGEVSRSCSCPSC